MRCVAASIQFTPQGDVEAEEAYSLAATGLSEFFDEMSDSGVLQLEVSKHENYIGTPVIINRSSFQTNATLIGTSRSNIGFSCDEGFTLTNQLTCGE